jgi:2-polyprenyl-3-methyl-5-hydroxy-6-metoxy-1,4-benzoquinol methylase
MSGDAIKSPMLAESWVSPWDGNMNSAEWENVSVCPLCGRTPPYRVVIDSEAMAKRFSSVVSNVEPWQLVECLCGLRFISPRWTLAYNRWVLAHPTGTAWAETLYQYGSFTPVPDPVAQKASVKSYYQHNFHGIRSLLRARTPRVIDVGCNVGWALRAFLDVGVSADSMGIDLEPTACRLAQEKLGLNVIEAAVSDLEGMSDLGRFDLVHCNDFIEHTLTPCDDLRTMRKLASRGSVLWIKTFAEELDERAGRTMLGPYSHFFHFTTHALRYPIRWWVEVGVQRGFVCVAA